MKKNNSKQKLSLGKTMIAKLSNDKMLQLKAGKTDTTGYGSCINNATAKCNGATYAADTMRCEAAPITGGAL